MWQFLMAVQIAFITLLFSIQAGAQNLPLQGHRTIALTLPEMVTPGSADSAVQSLRGYDNKILSSVADYNEQQVKVEYDAGHIKVEDIMQILWQAGFKSYFISDGKKYEMSDSPEIAITNVKGE